MIKIGLFTDVHYGEGGNANRNCAAGLKKIAKLTEALSDCDLIVDLGDTLNGEEDPGRVRERWEEIRALPGYDRVITMVGNHDAFCLPKELLCPVADPAVGAVKCLNTEGTALIFLDANFYHTSGRSYDGTPGDWTDAEVPAAQLSWLADRLFECDRAIVFVHHCLVNTRISLLSPEDSTDPECVRNAADVRRVLEQSGKVRQVVMGHNHRNTCVLSGGIAFTVGAVGSAVFSARAEAARAISLMSQKAALLRAALIDPEGTDPEG